MKIQKTFRAAIHQLDSGTAIDKWEESVAYFGSTKSVKAKGTIDGIPNDSHALGRRNPIHPSQQDVTQSTWKAAR